MGDLTSKMQQKTKWCYWDTLLLGVLFALAFCPYSGVLFFWDVGPNDHLKRFRALFARYFCSCYRNSGDTLCLGACLCCFGYRKCLQQDKNIRNMV